MDGEIDKMGTEVGVGPIIYTSELADSLKLVKL